MFRASLRNVLAMAVLAAGAFAACGDSENDGGGGAGAGTSSAGNAAGAGMPAGGNGAGTSNGAGGSGAGTSDGGGGNPDTGGGGVMDGGGGVGGEFLLCPEMELPVISELPDTLSETGLYSDILTSTVAPYVRDYEPKYPLWSDDADKSRWAYIPTECDGVTIDTSDMDTWDVPPGTRFWKEFVRDDTRVETRIIVRTGTGDFDYKFGAYVWNAGQTEAVLTDQGADDVLGTPHDVPPKSLCAGCHKKDWRILGFSAIQLTHSLPGETMASLSAEGALSVPDADGTLIPGGAAEPALGVLHANCGNCHYAGGVAGTTMKLRALVSHTTLQETDVWTTAVNMPSGNTDLCLIPNCDFIQPGPGGAANSLIAIRMGLRGGGQMPPYATDDVDVVGLGTVTTWIESLPP